MLPTPFNIDKDIVWEDLTKLIENQISMGAHGISALGLGGEASFLTNDKRRAIT